MSPDTVLVTADTGEQPQTWFFTFGSGQQYDGRYVTIVGTYAGARDEMVRHFGNRWSFQYLSRYAAGIDGYGLRVLPHRDWPAATAPLPGPPTGPTVTDSLCGHLPGERHDQTCAYWRGVALGEYPAPERPMAACPVHAVKLPGCPHTNPAPDGAR